jgi:spermidine/putrescine transport system ATP-binding protein
MTQEVELDRLTVRFGAQAAVDDIALTIKAGEFFSILGPSGCGKTTALRAVSGFVTPSAGVVRIGGKDMTGIGPNRRPTAMIFQTLALFPLMTVEQNIGFGLEVRGLARAERRSRIAALLELIALEGLERKPIGELSGGQRQRVAIARALAVEPAVLLLDEPLSALDLKLRQHMRAELRAIQRKTGVTFIYITHDQGEALAMSDRVAVMARGRIEQIGAPSEIYDAPETPFVATFVGESNAVPGTVAAVERNYAALDTPLGRLIGRNPHGLQRGAAAMLYVRPERCGLANGADDANLLPGVFERLDFEGAHITVIVRADGERRFAAILTNQGGLAAPRQGEPTRLAFSPSGATILPRETAPP